MPSVPPEATTLGIADPPAGTDKKRNDRPDRKQESKHLQIAQLIRKPAALETKEDKMSGEGINSLSEYVTLSNSRDSTLSLGIRIRYIIKKTGYTKEWLICYVIKNRYICI